VSRIGIVVGMQAEAACVAAAAAPLPITDRPLLVTAGASAARAEEAALDLAARQIGGLLSFGLCGGLDPGLRCGDLVLADAVLTPDGKRWPVDRTWHDRMAGRLERRGLLVAGSIAGQDRMVATVAAKRALRQLTGAVAVDMESHGVARAARAKGLPFLALRLTLDAADMTVPWSAQAGLAPDGRVRALPVLGRLLMRPWELPALLELGRANKAALALLGGLAADLAALGFLM
jgi:adenosylhomocysteine nucleosidase